MSPIHFDLLERCSEGTGITWSCWKMTARSAMEMGLKYVNNDACYPSVITVGQMMEAVLSGEYDVNRLALIMTQTGGCCRASNYVGFIRRALDKAGLPQIPVIFAELQRHGKESGLPYFPGHPHGPGQGTAPGRPDPALPLPHAAL